MPDMAALDAYLDDTAGAVFALAAEILGAQGPERRARGRVGW